MELISRHKRHILIILALAALFCAGRFHLETVKAEDDSAQSSASPKETGDSKKPAPVSDAKDRDAEAEPPADPNISPTQTPSEPAGNEDVDDPNAIAEEEDSEDDPFLPKLSTLVLLQETYDRIFTPELITDDGLVKYSLLRRKRNDLVIAARHLKNIHPVILMGMSKEEKIAFWINAYNVCMLQVIVKHYPIEPKWYMIRYPDNSIMQISGAWTKEYFWIRDEQLNLKEIEKEFLLDRYKDPRICFALSYATKGGAWVRNERYKGETLSEQLDDNVKKFLASDKGMRLDTENRVVSLSYVFQMNKKTFLESKYAEIRRFRERKPEERAWLNFIVPYLSEEDAKFFDDEDFTIDFIDYNWELNEKH